MVPNMNKYEELNFKVQSILHNLKVKFTNVDIDGDLNYSIQISTIGKLKNLNYINALLYFEMIDDSMNFFVGNIYKILKSDDVLSIYEKINYINNTNYSGHFSVYGNEKKQIVYRSSIFCGDDFCCLNEQLIQSIIIPFIAALEELIELFKKENND